MSFINNTIAPATIAIASLESFAAPSENWVNEDSSGFISGFRFLVLKEDHRGLISKLASFLTENEDGTYHARRCTTKPSYLQSTPRTVINHLGQLWKARDYGYGYWDNGESYGHELDELDAPGASCPNISSTTERGSGKTKHLTPTPSPNHQHSHAPEPSQPDKAAASPNPPPPAHREGPRPTCPESNTFAIPVREKEPPAPISAHKAKPEIVVETSVIEEDAVEEAEVWEEHWAESDDGVSVLECPQDYWNWDKENQEFYHIDPDGSRIVFPNEFD